MKRIKTILIVLIVTFLLGISSCISIDLYVQKSTENMIIDDIIDKKLDCILILGAGLNEYGKPSMMLKERLDKGIELYKENASAKIIVSGDHGSVDYDEVNVMKEYILEAGIPSEDIFMDHAGFSTYDSVYRAKEIFGVESLYIVTQKYHLYRALYIADKLDLEAYGSDAQEKVYSGQTYRDGREFLARIKDFLKAMIKPEPKNIGEEISVRTSGTITNDKEYILIKDLNKEKDKYLVRKDLDEIKGILKELQFKKRNCDLSPAFKLIISDDRAYDVEIEGDLVHLSYDQKETILTKKGSSKLIKILNGN